MLIAVGYVKQWQVDGVEGATAPMKAASLVKPVLAHLALEVFDDLDTPLLGDITVRHALSHTTGLPNWRTGAELTSIRPPGVQWGYSGEGFVLLQRTMEQRCGRPIDEIASERLFEPLGMPETYFDPPEPGFHGSRPLLTTASDYASFLAHALGIHDARWEPQWRIDDELAWGAGWGLELGPSVHGWQWGLDADAGNFTLGCPATGEGVVVFTDDPQGRERYREIVLRALPGDHPSLRVEDNPTWLALVG
jgi:CubicO group peptidase (beta-lactamase class C family)